MPPTSPTAAQPVVRALALCALFAFAGSPARPQLSVPSQDPSAGAGQASTDGSRPALDPVLAALEKQPHITVKPEEAVLGVEVRNTSTDGAAASLRTGCGLLLRCDGFVLVPTDLVALTRTGESEYGDRQKVTVVLYPGTPRERRANLRKLWRYEGRGLRYLVLKLDGFHAPALRTLAPDGLKDDEPLTVWFARYDAKAGRWRAVERRSVRLGARAGMPTGRDEKGAKSEDRLARELSAGTRQFAEPLEDAPAGALVTGPDDLAVGLTVGGTGSRTHAGFASFAVLNRATNCVSPLPVADSQLAAWVGGRPGPEVEQPGAAPGDTPPAAPAEAPAAPLPAVPGPDPPAGMVKVPGGPIVLPGAVCRQQTEMHGERLACVGDFLLDKLEVTNSEYLAFWLSLTPVQRANAGIRQDLYPLFWLDWSEERLPFGEDLASLPVMGVPYAGAQAYARWRGKRLPTPYEWCRAAYGAGGEEAGPAWVATYLADRRATWRKVVAAHLQYAHEHPADMGQEYLPAPGDPRSYTVGPSWQRELPWLVRTTARMNVSGFSREVLLAALDSVYDRWRCPDQVVPVGMRPFDVSPYGAADMLLNADEWVVPPAADTTGAGPAYMALLWTPTTMVALGQRREPLIPLRVAHTDGPSRYLYMPLSRLCRLFAPSAQSAHRRFTPELLSLVGALQQAVAMAEELSGCYLSMQRALTTGQFVAEYYTPDLQERAGCEAWRGGPHRLGRETDRAPSVVPGRERPIGRGAVRLLDPDASYLVPVGFRCAR